jgi:hypothetical protein
MHIYIDVYIYLYIYLYIHPHRMTKPNKSSEKETTPIDQASTNEEPSDVSCPSPPGTSKGDVVAPQAPSRPWSTSHSRLSRFGIVMAILRSKDGPFDNDADAHAACLRLLMTRYHALHGKEGSDYVTAVPEWLDSDPATIIQDLLDIASGEEWCEKFTGANNIGYMCIACA